MILKITCITVIFYLSASFAVAQEYHTVTRLIDGDTFEIENGETVRLIGVDTPKIDTAIEPEEYYGKYALYALKYSLELKGKIIRIETDEEKYDKYGRLLAYAWYKKSDGKEIFINSMLITVGFGHIYFYPPNVKYFENLMDAHDTAKELEIGIWDYTERVESLGEEEAKNEADKAFNKLVLSLQEGRVIKEIIFENDKLSVYVDVLFNSISMPDKKSFFKSIQSQYVRESGIKNLKILSYEGDEIIGLYDENGLIFVK